MRLRVAWSLAALALGAIPVFGAGSASAADSIYSFADQCRTLQVGGGAVTRTALGYGVKGGSPAPFYLKASALGLSAPVAMQRGTFPVIEAERGARVVAEIKFREIAMQMLLAAVLIDAAHPALENREVAFC